MNTKDYKLSKHLEEKITKGNVNEEYVSTTLNSPDAIIEVEDDEVHLFKKIINFGNRCFKVVVNPLRKLVVTAYFDRKLTKQGCHENIL